MNMKNGLDVMEQVMLYFKENLPRYTVLETRKNPTILTIPIFTWYQQKGRRHIRYLEMLEPENQEPEPRAL